MSIKVTFLSNVKGVKAVQLAGVLYFIRNMYYVKNITLYLVNVLKKTFGASCPVEPDGEIYYVKAKSFIK
jgi:hypothetical protein